MSEIKRVFLHPGYVTSQHDGDRHYITALQLRQLYEIPSSVNCITVREGSRYDKGYRKQDGDLHLYPDPRGRYAIYKDRI